MEEINLNTLKENEEYFRGHMELFDDTVEEVGNIVNKYGGEEKSGLERDIIQLIINAR